MSTRWSIRCVDCDVVGGMEIQASRTRPTLVLQFIALADKLAAIHVAAEELRAAGTSVVVGEPWECFDGSFFVTHRGHKLVARDEYGCDYGKCTGRVLCTCGTRVHCALDDGHEGPCTLLCGGSS